MGYFSRFLSFEPCFNLWARGCVCQVWSKLRPSPTEQQAKHEKVKMGFFFFFTHTPWLILTIFLNPPNDTKPKEARISIGLFGS